MDQEKTSSSPTLKSSWQVSCGLLSKTQRENSQRSRWNSSQCGGITKMTPWRNRSRNSLLMGSLSLSMLDGPCMMRLVQHMMIWSTTWRSVTNGFSKSSELSQESDGKSIHSVTQTQTLDFSLKWDSMPGSLQDLTTWTKIKEWTKNHWSGSGCQMNKALEKM